MECFLVFVVSFAASAFTAYMWYHVGVDVERKRWNDLIAKGIIPKPWRE